MKIFYPKIFFGKYCHKNAHGQNFEMIVGPKFKFGIKLWRGTRIMFYRKNGSCWNLDLIIGTLVLFAGTDRNPKIPTGQRRA